MGYRQYYYNDEGEPLGCDTVYDDWAEDPDDFYDPWGEEPDGALFCKRCGEGDHWSEDCQADLDDLSETD